MGKGSPKGKQGERALQLNADKAEFKNIKLEWAILKNNASQG